MLKRELPPTMEVFSYPEMPWLTERDGLPEAELRMRFAEIFSSSNSNVQGGVADEVQVQTSPARPKDEEIALRMASECRLAEERGRSEGIELGRSQAFGQAREEAARQLHGEHERLHAQARALVDSFEETRDSYLHQLEQESVRLALAIAARVLRREAQMDPLLLMGAVRVALGQLAESTTVRLRVPERDLASWLEAVVLIPGLARRPEVIGEREMQLGDCRMETELGSVNLGLWAQLKEIERGFFDRVGSAPADSLGQEGNDGDR